MNVFAPLLWLFSSFPLYCILSSPFLCSVQIGLYVFMPIDSVYRVVCFVGC